MVGRRTSPSAAGRTGRPRRPAPKRWPRARTQGPENTGSGIRPRPHRLPLPGGADLMRRPQTGGSQGIAGPRRPPGAAAHGHYPPPRHRPVCAPQARRLPDEGHPPIIGPNPAAAGAGDPSAHPQTGPDRTRIPPHQTQPTRGRVRECCAVTLVHARQLRLFGGPTCAGVPRQP